MYINFRRFVLLFAVAVTIAAGAIADTPPQIGLRQLMEHRFGNLLAAEDRLIFAALVGETGDFSDLSGIEKSIRGDLLAWLCTDSRATAQSLAAHNSLGGTRGRRRSRTWRADRILITGDWQSYQGTLQPGWWALDNPWNNGSLVNGKNYTQTITVTVNQFPNNTVANWSWPHTLAPTYGVYGYPEVVYGWQNGTLASPDGKGPTPVQLKNLTALTWSFNITTTPSSPTTFDVLGQTVLTSTSRPGTGAGNQLFTVGFYVYHEPNLDSWISSHSINWAYNVGGLIGTVYRDNTFSPPFIFFVPSANIFSGTIDLKAFFNWTTTKHITTGNEYIGGWEIACEPQRGIGSYTLNSINYNWNGVRTPPSKPRHPRQAPQ